MSKTAVYGHHAASGFCDSEEVLWGADPKDVELGRCCRRVERRAPWPFDENCASLREACSRIDEPSGGLLC